MVTYDARIYTIGHSNHPSEQFVGLLNQHAITALADIRSVPFSRFPQFNQGRLSCALETAGICYFFLGETLGGRIRDPGCYLEKVIPERKNNIAELVDYNQLINRPWFRSAIQELILLAQQFKIAIMCSEEDPARCHRHLLIARRLVDLGLTVEHIRKDGRLEPATFKSNPVANQPPLFM